MLLRTVIAAALLYTFACAALYTVMRQSPDAFAAAMKHMPPPALMALPFRSLWMNARSGLLRAGDQAPDFELDSLDHKDSFRLSSLRGRKPVVLVFGSYT